MTSRLHTTALDSLTSREYDTLVAEALHAFQTDVVYAIQVVESARTISNKKKRSASKKLKPNV